MNDSTSDELPEPALSSTISYTLSPTVAVQFSGRFSFIPAAVSSLPDFVEATEASALPEHAVSPAIPAVSSIAAAAAMSFS